MEAQSFSQQTKNQIVILQINKTQNYAWGYRDKNCLVGFMTEQEAQNYAQFWMGTHPNGQSYLNQQKSLKQFLKQNQIQEIDFLFKILSIQKSLSIQAHPNKIQARQLHQAFPSIYLDARDKPEIFLTLSDQFQLFLGFIQQKELTQLLLIEPFKTLGSCIIQTQHHQKIINLLEKLVYLNEKQLKQHIEVLFLNITHLQEKRQKVLKRIFNQYGIDTGILVSCLLQHHILQKGSSFGIQAGVPHAYVKGECFELMKSSDNVVRLGLTSKKKDIPNLLKIIKNNIQKSYCRVEKKTNKFMEKIQWNSFSIIELKLKEEPNKIQIHSNSIGILLNGQASIIFSEGGKTIVEIIKKSVFFILKGAYRFKGKGQIFIASKD